MSIVDPRTGEPLATDTPQGGAPDQDQERSETEVIIDVDRNNIQQLLQFSMQVPVLLFCWSTGNEQSRNLTPLLEKLAREYQGTFILGKLDIDDNQDIAAQLGVASVPDVKLVSQGGLVDNFQGALPEAQIREWLSRYFPAPKNLPASPEEQAAQALEAGDTATARTLYEELVKQNPEHYPYQVELASTLVAEGQPEDARTIIDNLPPAERATPSARGVRARIEFGEEAPSAEEVAALGDRDDSEARYLRAMRQVADGDYEAGLDSLLDLVKHDRTFGEDLARMTLLRVFDALGADHPLTVAYRRKLFALLY